MKSQVIDSCVIYLFSFRLRLGKTRLAKFRDFQGEVYIEVMFVAHSVEMSGYILNTAHDLYYEYTQIISYLKPLPF